MIQTERHKNRKKFSFPFFGFLSPFVVLISSNHNRDEGGRKKEGEKGRRGGGGMGLRLLSFSILFLPPFLFLSFPGCGLFSPSEKGRKRGGGEIVVVTAGRRRREKTQRRNKRNPTPSFPSGRRYLSTVAQKGGISLFLSTFS